MKHHLTTDAPHVDGDNSSQSTREPFGKREIPNLNPDSLLWSPGFLIEISLKQVRSFVASLNPTDQSSTQKAIRAPHGGRGTSRRIAELLSRNTTEPRKLRIKKFKEEVRETNAFSRRCLGGKVCERMETFLGFPKSEELCVASIQRGRRRELLPAFIAGTVREQAFRFAYVGVGLELLLESRSKS